MNNISLAKDLATKKKLQLELKLLKNKAMYIDLLLSNTAEAELLQYKSNPKICSLLNDNSKAISISEWSNAPYNKNPNYKEQLTFPCPSGQIVRSKSEVFIDMVLSSNNIPYRYECELLLGNHCYYPDFTFKHPITGEIFYWEHFGIMDNEDYAFAAFNKLKQYYHYGLIQGKNLITTYESKAKPFSYKEAEAAISFLLI